MLFTVRVTNVVYFSSASSYNIIIGATEIVKRSLRKNLEAVPGKHSIDSLQTTAILGT